MYLGNADPMLQVARYKNNEDVTRAAAHHISKTVAGQRARDRSLGRRSSHHLPALGWLERGLAVFVKADHEAAHPSPAAHL